MNAHCPGSALPEKKIHEDALRREHATPPRKRPIFLAACRTRPNAYLQEHHRLAARKAS